MRATAALPRLRCRFCGERPVEFFLLVDKKRGMLLSKDLTCCEDPLCKRELEREATLDHPLVGKKLLPFAEDSLRKIPVVEIRKAAKLWHDVSEENLFSV